MQYYQVRPEADQVRTNIRFINSFLIAHELYTQSEIDKALSKARTSPNFIDTHFVKVEISKRKTYWFCGARKASQLN